jgi:hypothetical protein
MAARLAGPISSRRAWKAVTCSTVAAQSVTPLLAATALGAGTFAWGWPASAKVAAWPHRPVSR